MFVAFDRVGHSAYECAKQDDQCNKEKCHPDAEGWRRLAPAFCLGPNSPLGTNERMILKDLRKGLYSRIEFWKLQAIR